MTDVKKVVLAYSGGLDTSVIVKWLKDNYGCEVVAYTCDVGQGAELAPIKDNAMKVGASKVYIQDVREEFVNDYVFRALAAGAVYEDKYLLATALARPLIAKKMIDVARAEGADAVAHGCTGKGNDQVRFDVGFQALEPGIKIIAPVREWEFKSRDEEMDYAREHGIPVPTTKENPYSLDKNLWGISIECGVLENPWNEPPEDIYQMTVSPEKAPNKAEYVEVEFESGIPVGLNGQRLDGITLIEKLNEIAGAHGVGRIDMVENRLVGIKSREIYECPAGTVLNKALRHLEDMTLDRETLHFKGVISQKYSEIIYYGLWFSPLREALDGFVDSVRTYVTGTVRVKLFKGQATVVGRKSPVSLYRHDLATYDADDMFDHKSAEGFINLWGLPSKVVSMVRNSRKDEE